MLRLTNRIASTIGTSKVGQVYLVYSDIVETFGDPIEGDGYKTTGEWIFEDDETGAVFTLYDWKSTYLYDVSLPLLEEFRSSKTPTMFMVGSNRKMPFEEFKTLLLKQIHYVKSGDKHADLSLLGHEVPYILGGTPPDDTGV